MLILVCFCTERWRCRHVLHRDVPRSARGRCATFEAGLAVLFQHLVRVSLEASIIGLMSFSNRVKEDKSLGGVDPRRVFSVDQVALEQAAN